MVPGIRFLSFLAKEPDPFSVEWLDFSMEPTKSEVATWWFPASGWNFPLNPLKVVGHFSRGDQKTDSPG